MLSQVFTKIRNTINNENRAAGMHYSRVSGRARVCYTENAGSRQQIQMDKEFISYSSRGLLAMTPKFRMDRLHLESKAEEEPRLPLESEFTWC